MRWTFLPAIAAIAVIALGCAERETPPAPGAGQGPVPDRTPSPADISALVLEADVAVMESFPVQLRGTLSVRNPTDRPIQFDVGGCPVFLRVYDRAGAVAWDQGDGAICTMILRTVTLAPGASETFVTGTSSAADILGEDLPDGTYGVAVYLALVEGGQPETSAGEVELAIPR
ncbi:MAG TPA: BsuPI-related putative proteinase inhibitor [Gemmatimonadota bacterium]|nr:BsuPI-related putative proteinase inhibitor [Gemmatimonadota bacterium]